MKKHKSELTSTVISKAVDRVFYQKMKASSFRKMNAEHRPGGREAWYILLKKCCEMLQEDCPPLEWFPLPRKIKSRSSNVENGVSS